MACARSVASDHDRRAHQSSMRMAKHVQPRPLPTGARLSRGGSLPMPSCAPRPIEAARRADLFRGCSARLGCGKTSGTGVCHVAGCGAVGGLRFHAAPERMEPRAQSAHIPHGTFAPRRPVRRWRRGGATRLVGAVVYLHVARSTTLLLWTALSLLIAPRADTTETERHIPHETPTSGSRCRSCRTV